MVMVVERLTFNLDEVAQLVGISRTSAYAGFHNGAIRGARIGRRIVVPRSEVDRILGVAGAARTHADEDPRDVVGEESEQTDVARQQGVERDTGRRAPVS